MSFLNSDFFPLKSYCIISSSIPRFLRSSYFPKRLDQLTFSLAVYEGIFHLTFMSILVFVLLYGSLTGMS